MDIDDEINKLQNIIIDCNNKINELKKITHEELKKESEYYDIKFLKYYINNFIFPYIIQIKKK